MNDKIDETFRPATMPVIDKQLSPAALGDERTSDKTIIENKYAVGDAKKQ